MPKTAPTSRSEVPAEPATALDVLQLLRAVSALADARSARVELATGVAGAPLWALHEIGQTEGLTVGALARRLRVHQTTASNLLNRLEMQGLVRKLRAAADQRVIELHLTPAGRRALARAAGSARGLLPQALESLGPARLRTLRSGLATLVDAMRNNDPAAVAQPRRRTR